MTCSGHSPANADVVGSGNDKKAAMNVITNLPYNRTI